MFDFQVQSRVPRVKDTDVAPTPCLHWLGAPQTMRIRQESQTSRDQQRDTRVLAKNPMTWCPKMQISTHNSVSDKKLPKLSRFYIAPLGRSQLESQGVDSNRPLYLEIADNSMKVTHHYKLLTFQVLFQAESTANLRPASLLLLRAGARARRRRGGLVGVRALKPGALRTRRRLGKHGGLLDHRHRQPKASLL